MEWNPLWVSAVALIVAAALNVANFLYAARTEKRRRKYRRQLDNLTAKLASLQVARDRGTQGGPRHVPCRGVYVVSDREPRRHQ